MLSANTFIKIFLYFSNPFFSSLFRVFAWCYFTCVLPGIVYRRNYLPISFLKKRLDHEVSLPRREQHSRCEVRPALLQPEPEKKDMTRALSIRPRGDRTEASGGRGYHRNVGRKRGEKIPVKYVKLNMARRRRGV